MGLFCAGGDRPPTHVMVRFIDEHRAIYGVEPICDVVPIRSVDLLRSHGTRSGSRPNASTIAQLARGR